MIIWLKTDYKTTTVLNFFIYPEDNPKHKNNGKKHKKPLKEEENEEVEEETV